MWRIAIIASLFACKKPVAEPAPAVAAAPLDSGASAAIADAPVDAGSKAVVADAPPTGPLIGRIIKVEVVGQVSFLTVPLGRHHGVEQGWSGCVLDVRDACIEDSSFIVVRVGAVESHVRSKLSAAVITQAGRVKLHSP